jgi:hypothetical protein
VRCEKLEIALGESWLKGEISIDISFVVGRDGTILFVAEIEVKENGRVEKPRKNTFYFIFKKMTIPCQKKKKTILNVLSKFNWMCLNLSCWGCVQLRLSRKLVLSSYCLLEGQQSFVSKPNHTYTCPTSLHEVHCKLQICRHN